MSLSANSSKTKRKVIIDVDTGIDDALAIAYLLGRREADLIGITTCFGNNTLANTTENTLRLLHLLKRDDIKVYPGAGKPINVEEWIVSEHLKIIHGHNGLGNVELEASPEKASDVKAWQFIIESCRKYGKDLDLVFVGPLTNLLLAYELDKEALASVNGITVMGGALTIAGNVTPNAEANLYNDVKAAKTILDSGLKINMIGLDVTLKTRIEGPDLLPLEEIDSDEARRLTQIAEYYYTNEDGVVGGAMHDALAVEAALNPEIITDWLDIELDIRQSGNDKGRICTDMQRLLKKDKNVRYALDVDGEAFIKKFINTICEVLKNL